MASLQSCSLFLFPKKLRCQSFLHGLIKGGPVHKGIQFFFLLSLLTVHYSWLVVQLVRRVSERRRRHEAAWTSGKKKDICELWSWRWIGLSRKMRRGIWAAMFSGQFAFHHLTTSQDKRKERHFRKTQEVQSPGWGASQQCEGQLGDSRKDLVNRRCGHVKMSAVSQSSKPKEIFSFLICTYIRYIQSVVHPSSPAKKQKHVHSYRTEK